jgi:hypothetical protein
VIGAVLAGGIAIFLVGLAIGMVVANVFVLRDAQRRSRVIGKARVFLRVGKERGLPAANGSPRGQPDGGPWR